MITYIENNDAVRTDDGIRVFIADRVTCMLMRQYRSDNFASNLAVDRLGCIYMWLCLVRISIVSAE